MKLVQLAGYVSEVAAYHHGEKSLQDTIVKLATDFVGSNNNVPLLYPGGQFGTRLQNGKDHASARYIFTRLRRISRTLFPVADDPVLAYLEDDGAVVEPKWFAPVIPLVLANGATGIATGWSTSVTTYDPRALITNVRHWIESGSAGERPLLTPWFRGFTGEVLPIPNKEGYYQTYGIARLEVHADSDAAYEEPASQGGSQGGSGDGGEGKAVATVFVTELPVGKATQDYKEWLESCLVDLKKSRKKKKSDESGGDDTSESESDGGGSQRGRKKKGKGAAKKKGGTKKKSASKDGKKAGAPDVVDIRENHTERKVDFEVKISARSLATLREMARSGSAAADDKSGAHTGMDAALIKMFALTGKGTLSPANMYLFGPEGNIKKCVQKLELCCRAPFTPRTIQLRADRSVLPCALPVHHSLPTPCAPPRAHAVPPRYRRYCSADEILVDFCQGECFETTVTFRANPSNNVTRSTSHILFISVRLALYTKRQRHQLAVLNLDLLRLRAQARFIKLVVRGELELRGRVTAELVAQLERLGLPGLGPRTLSKKTKALASLFALEAATGAKVQVLSPVRMRLSDAATKSAEAAASSAAAVSHINAFASGAFTAALLERAVRRAIAEGSITEETRADDDAVSGGDEDDEIDNAGEESDEESAGDALAASSRKAAAAMRKTQARERTAAIASRRFECVIFARSLCVSLRASPLHFLHVPSPSHSLQFLPKQNPYQVPSSAPSPRTLRGKDGANQRTGGGEAE